MNKEEYNYKVNLLWCLEIILEELKEKNKIRGKKLKEIENKLRKLSYQIWLNSPKIKYDENKKKEIALKCILDYLSHNGGKK